ncbi:hypothetical protein BC939DRAFT_442013 [Gamsiella multidivaricata]|uniref:uncharacterized protein n=1 Tax=Gamsiella multidivaricata TaxID=101098 RepID=UPI00221E63F5|nr:uncharacterized protein BC939DRAFT_442013 [Gamsiella multidivaricata]KAI7829473.1 hypothetical protein BC939DRAFT_442013 [Gamsiella multidivaricata]
MLIVPNILQYTLNLDWRHFTSGLLEGGHRDLKPGTGWTDVVTPMTKLSSRYSSLQFRSVPL